MERPGRPRAARAALSRRALVEVGVSAGLGAAAAFLGCSRRATSEPSADAKGTYAALNAAEDEGSAITVSGGRDAGANANANATRAQVLEWSFGGDASPEARAAVVLPPLGPSERTPLLIALHGRGEARKGPELGALGWPHDYALPRAARRLRSPPLRAADFEGFVAPQRLADHNARLARQAYRGLVVVCPYLPDLDLRSPLALRDYANYLKHTVLPRARRELPVFPGRASTGIDGVSLGGIVALRAGLAHPEEYACVGSLQAAIDDPWIPELVEAVRAARSREPSLRLRLLTSDRDYFRRVITAASQALRAASLEHEYLLVPGPHDYPFNRGPGALEMLLWHDLLLAHA
jgi:hypothetical protein